MTRRDFAVLGVSGATFAALAGSALAQQGAAPKGIEHAEHDVGLQACAKACSDCQRACDTCSTHCAHQVHAGKGEHMTALMTCQDCADICAAASQVAARGGPCAALVCQACADCCAQCAKECEKFPQDAHMKLCAAECRKCEQACRSMVKNAAPAAHAPKA